jgi:hypothetical protein
MKIIARGTDDDSRVFQFEMEGASVGIRDVDHEVIIEVQDLVRTVVIHATFAELERVIAWCRRGKEAQS